MIVGNLESTEINGQDFWTVKQFSELTGRTEYTIRLLSNKGNSIRKLSSKSINSRKYIFAQELLDFPFTITGRPTEEGYKSEKFYLDEKTGELSKRTENCNAEN